MVTNHPECRPSRIATVRKPPHSASRLTQADLASQVKDDAAELALANGCPLSGSTPLMARRALHDEHLPAFTRGDLRWAMALLLAMNERPDPGLREEPAPAVDELVGTLAYASICLGDYCRAEALLCSIRPLAGEPADGQRSMSRQVIRLLLDWRLGRWQGLAHRAAESRLATPGSPGLTGEAETVLGLLLLAQGQVDAADHHLHSACGYFQAGGWIPAFITAAAGRGCVFLRRDNPDGAFGAVAPALDLVRRQHVWVYAAEIATIAIEALLASSPGAQATELVHEFSCGIRGREAPAAAAGLLRCLGLVAAASGDYERAAAHFGDAEQAWSALPNPYEAARAREARAGCLLASRAPAAEPLLRDALEVFSDLGARGDVARVLGTYRRLGLALPQPAPGHRKAYAGELTPREREVAALVARAMRNSEIAAALTLSSRTVEKHLASALHKMGLRSRTELAVAYPLLPPERRKTGSSTH